MLRKMMRSGLIAATVAFQFGSSFCANAQPANQSGPSVNGLGQPVVIRAGGIMFTPFTAEDKTLDVLIQNQDRTRENGGRGMAYFSMNRRLFCNARGIDLRTGRPTVCPGPLIALPPNTAVQAVLDSAGEPVKPDAMTTVLVKVGDTYGAMRWSDYDAAESAPRMAAARRAEAVAAVAAAEKAQEAKEASAASAAAAAEVATRQKAIALQAENRRVAAELQSHSAVCYKADRDRRPPCDIPTMIITAENNDARFDRDYTDRTISVKGRLLNLTHDYITIGAGSEKATCYFENGDWSQESRMADWNHGDIIVITGRVGGVDGQRDRAATALHIWGCAPRKF
jgi:hypothetical protein